MKKEFFLISIIFLLIGNLCLGISHVAMLPPWEGFDETAHYSYLQQIADIGTLPRLGKDRLSGDVERYRAFAPIPYSGTPPMENNGGFTYKSFFEASPDIVQRGYEHVHIRPNEPRHYTEGAGLNWQSQHPPLYYFVLSLIYSRTQHLSWSEQILILRLISYLFAWMALIVGIYSCFVMIQKKTETASVAYWAALGIAIWPILFPAWFPDMARLGNDSLCALIMALVWFVCVKVYVNKVSLGYSLALGVLLALGCLTKAFFVPVTVGVLGFWCFRYWKLAGKQFIRTRLVHLSLIPILILFIAGWWYIANLYENGTVPGSIEVIMLRDAGGLLKGLQENFSIVAWLRGHLVLITTLSWCSSWSWVRPPYIFLAPMVFIVVLVFISYVISLRRFDVKSIFWLPAWCILPTLLGFSYHVLLRVALTGEGKGTSGYYLNFLVVPLGVALGVGFGALWVKRAFRIMASVLALYAIILSVGTTWAQILLFSGITFKAGSSKFYQLPETMPPLLGLPDALVRLKVIAFPSIGVFAWVIGSVVTLAGLAFLWRAHLDKLSTPRRYNQKLWIDADHAHSKVARQPLLYASCSDSCHCPSENLEPD